MEAKEKKYLDAIRICKYSCWSWNFCVWSIIVRCALREDETISVCRFAVDLSLLFHVTWNCFLVLKFVICVEGKGSKEGSLKDFFIGFMRSFVGT